MNRIRKSFNFPAHDLENIKRRMLHWANPCNILLFLDSNEYTHTEGKYECLCGIGAMTQIANDDAQFSKTRQYHSEKKDWLFGNINYDFKNCLEHLSSKHSNHFSFPETHFFCPEIVCYIPRNESKLYIESATRTPDDIWNELNMQDAFESSSGHHESISFTKRIQKADYLRIIAQLQKHIIEGDCYEINFCNEAYCIDADINPLSIYQKLNQSSKAPFAAYYKLENQFMLCASPERFLRKEGNRIVAQPIKGTAARMSDIEADDAQKKSLLSSMKERAENVMIVDLMRNDLARFCETGSVKVEELFGIYSFPQVHQMISTISGQIDPRYSLFDAIRLAFPMGSMTGAPKIMVMELIERYEAARRGLFSGCVGYISPEGNFDFNVVIRSLFYNQTSQYLSYQTGGAITHDSVAEEEWQETLLKASAIEKIFAD